MKRKYTHCLEYGDVAFDQIKELCASLGATNDSFFKAQGNIEYYRAYRIYYESVYHKRYRIYYPTKQVIQECLQSVAGKLEQLKMNAEKYSFWQLLEKYKKITGAHETYLSAALGYDRTYIAVNRIRNTNAESLKEDLLIFIDQAIRKLSQLSFVL